MSAGERGLKERQVIFADCANVESPELLVSQGHVT